MPSIAPPTAADLLIRHAYVITMNDDGWVEADGAVVVSGRRIVEVGADASLAARYVAKRTIDAGGAPVHPGLIECHLHASFHIRRGAIPDAVPAEDVFDLFERPYYETVTDEEEYLGTVLASMEMIRNGTTCFMEAGTILRPDSGAEAAEFIGIRALIGDGRIVDRQASGRIVGRSPRSTADAIARLGGVLGRNADPDALVTGHVAVLGLGSASEELLIEAKRVADEAGVVLDMHHAYAAEDTAMDRARYGMDPLVRLAEIGILGPNVALGHANHLTDAEAEAVAGHGTNLVWAPAASAMWGHADSFRGRHAELWRRGVNVALGSDSGNWSNDFDLFRQANLALLAARADHDDRAYLLAEDVLRMATRGGARATGLEDRIGSIEVGKRADLVIHTLARPELNPTTHMIRNLVCSAGSKSVRTVIVDGRVILDDGVFPAFDEAALLARINVAAMALQVRMGSDPGSESTAPRRR